MGKRCFEAYGEVPQLEVPIGRAMQPRFARRTSGLRALLLLAQLRTIGGVTMTIECASRKAERPLRCSKLPPPTEMTAPKDTPRDGIPLIFIHIPKCVGNSIHNLLLGAAGKCKSSVVPQNQLCYKAACADCGCKQWDANASVPSYVTGHTHFGFGLGPQLLTLRPLFVTVVREPIRWLVSQMWFKKGLGDRTVKDWFSKANGLEDHLKLDSLVTSLPDSPKFLQYLSDLLDKAGPLPFLAGTTDPKTVHGTRLQELQCAAWNLLHVDVIGDVNDIPGFLAQLRFHLGSEIIPSTDLKVANPSAASRRSIPDAFSPRAVELLHNVTAEHARFYNISRLVVQARTAAATGRKDNTECHIPLPDREYRDLFTSPPPAWCEATALNVRRPARFTSST